MPRTTRRLTIQTALTVPPARLTLNNREYLTAPAVLIVEGVLNGAYIPGSELIAPDWNNVPVVLNHPLDAQGVPMSARTPEVLAASGVGHLYRARLGTGQRQGHTVTSLQAELWLDVAQVEEVGGEAVQAMTMLEAQTPLELSTGFYSYAEETPGSFYGVPYSEVHHDLRPDHLALLPNGIGACDWQSGCGSPRLNQQCTCHQETPMDHAQARGWRGFVHTLKTFVQQEEQEAGSREQEAGSRKQEAGSSDPASRSTLLASRSTLLASRFSLHASPKVQQEETGREPGAPAVFVNGYYVGDGTQEQVCALARQLPTPPLRTHLTDADIRESLYGALAREMSVDFTPIFIDAVDVANQTFTYRQGERLLQRSWTETDGQIALTEGATDVQRQTTYLPVTHEQEDPPMATEAVKARVTALITKTKWTESDRAMLEAMSEEQLTRLEPTPPAPEPTTVDEALASLPENLRESMGQMVRAHDTRKQAMITALVAAKYPLSEARLKALELHELEQLVPLTFAQEPSYAGQGLPALRQQDGGEDAWKPLSNLTKKE
jgi:hypothetical protein